MTARTDRDHTSEQTTPTTQARMITKSSVVTSLVVRAAGLVPARLDLAHVGTPEQGSLAAPAVVGAFDPGDNRQTEFLAGGPPLPVENVLFQQGEERLHHGVSLLTACAVSD